ncbi:MAG: hypothetical protein AAF823_08830 [Planctomycetota bacterium]
MHRLQTIAATLFTCGATSAHAFIFIDDFTQTADPSSYPATIGVGETAEGAILGYQIVDPIGQINGTDAVRSTVIWADDPVDGSPSFGHVGIDLQNGALTVQAGNLEPGFNVNWLSADDEHPLDMDLSTAAGFEIDYETNLDVSIRFVLYNMSGGHPVAASFADATLRSDRSRVFIASDELMTVTTLFTQEGPVDGLPLDPASVDFIGFWFGGNNPWVPDAPPYLVISFDRIAVIIPEPSSSLIGLGVVGGLLLSRQRGPHSANYQSRRQRRSPKPGGSLQ